MSKKSVRIPSLDLEEVSRLAADLEVNVSEALRIAFAAGLEELRRRADASTRFVVGSKTVSP